MARKKVIWTKNAEFALFDILDFYIQRNKSKEFSTKLLKKIKSLIKKIERYPYLGLEIEGTDYREIIFTNYSIIYSLSDSCIVIKLIWDHKRNPEEFKKAIINYYDKS